MAREFCTLSTQQALEELQTPPEGLSDAEAAFRLAKFGKNTLERKRMPGVLEIFLRQFRSLIILILFFAALVSFFLDDILEAGIILILVILNAVIGAYHEFRAEKALDALKKFQPHEVKVLRGGAESIINSEDLVLGDIVALSAGDKVPADGRIIDGARLRVDESTLTGESNSVSKITDALQKEPTLAERKNMLYSGTLIISGRALLAVSATDAQTELGKVYEKISAEREHFPIQKKMDEFSRRLGAITLLGVAVLSLFGVFLLSYTPTEILKIAVAQAVSFVPEGLPIVVTIALALSVFEMAKKNALTRKLQAIETIGIVGVICVDKTGTLTQNRMRVQRVFLDFADFEIGESGKVACEGKPADLLEQPHFVELLKTGVLCNDAVDGDSSKHHEPVETALLEFALPFGYEKKKLEAMRQRTGEVPFDPKNKYMITMNRKDEKTHFNLKGAPEVVLSMCSKILKRGKAHPITPKHKKIILATTEKYAREGLRVMAFAYKNAERSKTIDNDYQFAGLVAFQDPLRAEAKAAVQKAREAGIRVIMITGDHCLTAQTIAREAGILLERGTVITGEEMERMGEKTLLRELARVQVFARVTSEHKLKIIELLKKRGEIVAMTGDGVNDALALKKADVGVALGSGTEVAKEASDIVLLDDNFSSLVDAVEEGRHSAMNIRRVVKYLFSTNFTEVLFLFIIIFSPVLFGTYLPLALLPIHILYVNLVTDGLCDVTLATEKKSENLMNKPPSYFKGGAFFSPDVMKFILATSLVSFTLLIFTYFYYLEHASSIGHMRTVVFTLLSFMQLWSAINARTASKSVFEAGFFSNRYLVGGIAVSIVVQLAAIYHPFFNEVLKTVPLTLFDWAVVLAGSTSLFMLFEIIKYFERRGMSIIS